MEALVEGGVLQAAPEDVYRGHAGARETRSLTLDRQEPLDGLEKDGHAQSEKENAIEEGTKQGGSSPAEGEIVGRFGSLRDLWDWSDSPWFAGEGKFAYDDSSQGNDEADQIVHLVLHVGQQDWSAIRTTRGHRQVDIAVKLT